MGYRLRVRRFLSRASHASGAYVIAVVPESLTCNVRGCTHTRCWDTELIISDGWRWIRFGAWWDTAAERRDTLYTLDVLIDTLTRYRAAIEVEFAQLAETEENRQTGTS